MFEEAQRLGDTERKIALETRLGRPIENYVEVDPPPFHSRNQYQALVDRCGRDWRERKPATGVYNCAGHVWASRRTTILDPEDWKRILDDDGYRELQNGEVPWPGDIVAYLDQDQGGEILHVGRVYHLARGLAEGSPPIPWVISKWNSTSGESLHQVYDNPYRRDFNVGIRFYTDRPKQAGGFQ
jgi:hypothetical protein